VAVAAGGSRRCRSRHWRKHRPTAGKRGNKGGAWQQQWATGTESAERRSCHVDIVPQAPQPPRGGGRRNPLSPHGMHSSLAIVIELGGKWVHNTETTPFRPSRRDSCRSGGWQSIPPSRREGGAKCESPVLVQHLDTRARFNSRASTRVS